jgi:hypothetical protein
MTASMNGHDYELLIKCSARFGLGGFGRTVPHAGNIKIKRNKKKKGFIGYRKFAQVQKNANDVSGNNLFDWLHFFAATVVLRIPFLKTSLSPYPLAVIVKQTDTNKI